MSIDIFSSSIVLVVFVESKSKEDRIWDYWKLVETGCYLLSVLGFLLSGCYLLSVLVSGYLLVIIVHYGSRRV